MIGRLPPIRGMKPENEVPAKVAFIVAKRLPSQVEAGSPIGLWTPDILEESVRRGSLPIVKLEWPESWDAFRLSTVADIASRAVVRAICRDSMKEAPNRDASALIPLPDDALIDQQDPRVPEKWFVRAAKAGRFPCSKEGGDYIACWRDVRAALALRTISPAKRCSGF